MIVTKKELRSAATDKGGFRAGQIELAQKITGVKKGWKDELVGSTVNKDVWLKFIELGKKRTNKNARKKILNSMSVDKDWSWNPQSQDIPEVKTKKNRGKKKQKRTKAIKLDNKGFYESREWRTLRVRILEKYECKCMMCGRSPKGHGVVIHVDHIKPRSKFPELSLEFNNLQILCEDCNLGKSNKYSTDYRPLSDDERELLFNAQQHL